jgi:16S rRNA (guanine966-N2)-methyltransferase
MMRVIAGSAKGRKLLAPEGMNTRPTTDRLKEALFGMIQFDVPQAEFLDLFAGSGAIGIEALSRGAKSLDLAEQDSKALSCIVSNLKNLKMEQKAKIWPISVEKALQKLSQASRTFDMIFMDPPYQKGWEDKICAMISEYKLLKPEGILIVESSSETEITAAGLTLIKEKCYKTTKFSFFRLALE